MLGEAQGGASNGIKGPCGTQRGPEANPDETDVGMVGSAMGQGGLGAPEMAWDPGPGRSAAAMAQEQSGRMPGESGRLAAS